eukprot:TRINITY_DN27617_c0_g1_i1.p1 TRINITY_DN27617_c0_g1~~TRINITY_DN27617_c0_g1_i1.p1  ORF type:complete len:565 (-),score=118.80 TRINITY_DN27617_c0_g1_i1:62-1723(-)
MPQAVATMSARGARRHPSAPAGPMLSAAAGSVREVPMPAAPQSAWAAPAASPAACGAGAGAGGPATAAAGASGAFPLAFDNWERRPQAPTPRAGGRHDRDSVSSGSALGHGSSGVQLGPAVGIAGSGRFAHPLAGYYDGEAAFHDEAAPLSPPPPRLLEATASVVESESLGDEAERETHAEAAETPLPWAETPPPAAETPEVPAQALPRGFAGRFSGATAEAETPEPGETAPLRSLPAWSPVAAPSGELPRAMQQGANAASSSSPLPLAPSSLPNGRPPVAPAALQGGTDWRPASAGGLAPGREIAWQAMARPGSASAPGTDAMQGPLSSQASRTTLLLSDGATSTYELGSAAAFGSHPRSTSPFGGAAWAPAVAAGQVAPSARAYAAWLSAGGTIAAAFAASAGAGDARAFVGAHAPAAQAPRPTQPESPMSSAETPPPCAESPELPQHWAASSSGGRAFGSTAGPLRSSGAEVWSAEDDVSCWTESLDGSIPTESPEPMAECLPPRRYSAAGESSGSEAEECTPKRSPGSARTDSIASVGCLRSTRSDGFS